MIRAIIRFLMLQIILFIDGLIVTVFDKNEIISYQLLVKPIQKTSSEQQQILVNYLKKCHKQTYKEDKNDKKRSKKEAD